MDKCVGVVVLCNPDSGQVINNILSYLTELDALLLVDNSAGHDSRVAAHFANHDKVKYLAMGDNRGVAYALNRGIDFAKHAGAKWLLTMDQDSSFRIGDFSKYLSAVLEESHARKNAVLFSPRQRQSDADNRTAVSKVLSAQMSGNLLNMERIDQVGPYEDKLFSDAVDYEFCLRANKLGLGVYCVNAIELAHHQRKRAPLPVAKRLFGRTVMITNDNYMKRYYKTRNLLYVRKMYANHELRFREFLLADLPLTCLTIGLYEDDKLRKFRSILKGIADFRSGRFGKQAL